MIKLYGMGSPNVVKIFIALEELGLPYDVAPVDVFTGKQFDAEFLKLNPNAKVPVIVDSEGPGGKPYSCFESGAILLYLAEKTGKLLSKDMAAKYDAIQWLMTQMSTVGPMFGQFVHFIRFAPGGNDYSKSRYTDAGDPRLRSHREAPRRFRIPGRRGVQRRGHRHLSVVAQHPGSSG
jgi:GST-like protein